MRSILIDLLKRETANFSADFSNTLVKRLGKTISLSRDPQRSAAFKVLRQADTPSVLVELGYMSHKEDEKLLNSAPWQTHAAAAIGAAVECVFRQKNGKGPIDAALAAISQRYLNPVSDDLMPQSMLRCPRRGGGFLHREGRPRYARSTE